MVLSQIPELKGFSQSVNNVGTATQKANRKSQNSGILMTGFSVSRAEGKKEILSGSSSRREKIDFMETAMDQCQFQRGIEVLRENNITRALIRISSRSSSWPVSNLAKVETVLNELIPDDEYKIPTLHLASQNTYEMKGGNNGYPAQLPKRLFAFCESPRITE